MHYEKIRLPDESATLTREEYGSLLYEIKSKVLGYGSIVDTKLTEFLSEIFLLDFKRKGLWFDTLFDEDRQATFGAKIVWLGKVMANHDEILDLFDNKRRKKLISKLEELAELRNLLAHTMTFHSISDQMIRERTIVLVDFKKMSSETIIKDMNEITDLVNDETILNEINELISLAAEIRRKRVDEMCKARKNEKQYLEELQKIIGDS